MGNKICHVFSSQTEPNKLNKHLYYCIQMVSLYLTRGQTIKCKYYVFKIMFSLHIPKFLRLMAAVTAIFKYQRCYCSLSTISKTTNTPDRTTSCIPGLRQSPSECITELFSKNDFLHMVKTHKSKLIFQVN